MLRNITAAAILLGLLALGGDSAFAQIPAQQPDGDQVVEVRITGNQSVAKEKILRQLRTRPGRPLSIETLEEDVRRLNATRMFVDVKPYQQRVPGGYRVIFEVVERPTLEQVQFVGNRKVSTKVLRKELDFKSGDALDPFAIEEGRRKLEEFYRGRGFSKARVSIAEGKTLNDRRVIYEINEGIKQKIFWTQFVGNTIASDARLRTQIQSKPPMLYLFSGEVDRDKIDQDVDRLTAYYRSLGFFRARVGRELEFNDARTWATLTFVIDEGPRYRVRDVSVLGNKRFPTEELRAALELQRGEFFNQPEMNHDVATIQEKYGSIGYVFADVKVEPRFLEEPGQLDLVYQVTEGARYRVGKIEVAITGEAPHTKITTILNRVSLRPGDIVDIRKLRASERRLKSSGLFLVDPMTGAAPKISFSPPELEELEEIESRMARPPAAANGFRGQSPDAEVDGRWQYIESGTTPDGDRRLDLRLPARWVQPPEPAPPATRQASPPRTIIRGQYSAEGGWSTPTLEPRYMTWGATSSQAAADDPRAYPEPVNQAPSYASPQTHPAPNNGTAPNDYARQPAPSQPAPSRWQPRVAASSPSSRPTASESLGTTRPPASAPMVPVRPNPAYANPAVPRGAYVPRRQTPVDEALNGGIFSEDSPFRGGAPGEPTRLLPLEITAPETQTGRLMFGVGINSDAGLIGSIVVDEQNFDWTRWPRGWQDVRNQTAFRGAGQRFRLEAIPGTEVQRYMINFQEPYFRNTDVSLGLSGFYYDRRYTEWDEQRLGGRITLGYQFRPDLTGSISYRGESVDVHDPISPTPAELTEVLGKNQIHGFRVQLSHDTRDSAFLATEGHLIELSLEQVVGTFTYPRAEVDLRRYFLLRERPDGSGRHVLSLSGRAAYTGSDTPIYDHYYAGGFSSLRGFDFRGASPIDPGTGVRVGGEFMALASIQYLFPITADDMLRGVVFCDTGTVQPTIDDWQDKYRISPGFGFRVTVPAMGPAPLAFDFAFPMTAEPGDDERVFSFFVGFNH